MTVIVDEVVAEVEGQRRSAEQSETDRPAPPPAAIDPRLLRETLRHAERRAARRRAF